MKSEWKDYLESLGFTAPLMERADTAISFYTETAQINPSFLFVSEYRDEERRVYGSLWLFSELFVCEAKDFVKENKFDCFASNSIFGWEALVTNYDWVSPNDGSRVTLNLLMENGVHGKLQASGANCVTLAELLKTHIIPSITSRAVS